MGCGYANYATTRYCQPKTKADNQEDAVPGLDVELSLFGFSGNISL